MIMLLKTKKYDHRLEPRKSRMQEPDSYEPIQGSRTKFY
jgi:hypothetical protein